MRPVDRAVLPKDVGVLSSEKSSDMNRLREILARHRFQRGTSIEERRELLEVAAGSARPIITDAEAGFCGVSGEWQRPDSAVPGRSMIHFHGGGFIMGSATSCRLLARNLAEACRSVVFVPNYRLAPEHPFPAALEDAVTCYRALIASGSSPNSIIVSGDSAGAGLAVSLVTSLRENSLPPPVACICLSPWADLTLQAPSIDAFCHLDPMVTRWQLREMAEAYLAGQPPSLPQASPVFSNLRGFPPMMIQYGAEESLRDDARALVAAAREAGVNVRDDPWPDVIHVWHAFAPRLAVANKALGAVGSWLESLSLNIPVSQT